MNRGKPRGTWAPLLPLELGHAVRNVRADAAQDALVARARS